MHRHPREPQGAALVVVVAFLVLLSGLVIAFYARVGVDLANSQSYAEGVNARQLADSAVGVVMGQIREATTVKNGAWASQPGMIRVYGKNGEPGSDAFAFYKLYSSHDLIVSSKEMNRFEPNEFDQAAVAKTLEVPLGKGGWRDQPAFFTDLNEPVEVNPTKSERARGRKSVKRYPIFDPRVAGLHDPSIVDPTRYERQWTVEGSSIALPKKLREDTEEVGGNEAPMPVRWIYVLRDGTLTAPTPLNGPATDREGSNAQWQVLSGGKYGVPTKTNPIVGRIAFWADDDSSKVNVNTAGGFISSADKDDETNPTGAMNYAGSFWDSPRLQTTFDRGAHQDSGAALGTIKIAGLANAQPAQNEFQRYPGHPATTSLDVVFKRLLREASGSAKPALDSEKLYAWLPRLTPGGSRGGSAAIDFTLDRSLPIKSPTDQLIYPKYPDLNGKTFHLYGSVDEMLYTPENGERRLAEQFLRLRDGTITPEILDQARFFLTTHSRAPELNLFGKPRVTIWPVWEEPAGIKNRKNTATDSLLQFCSRVGGLDFIFSRKDPYSPTADFDLPRNRALFDYLRELTSKDTGRIPGFGGSFEEKFATSRGGRDQLLTEIFDYIRTVNLKDTTRFKDIDAGGSNDPQRNAEKEKYMYAPRGIVVPTRAKLGEKEVSGFGRFPTISEASIVFYHAGWVGRLKDSKDKSEKLIQNPLDLPKYDLSHKLVRAFLVFETYNPMQGYATISQLEGKKEKFIHHLELPTDFTIRSNTMEQPKALGFPSSAENEIDVAPGDTWEGRGIGGTEGFFHTMRDKVDASLRKSDRDDPTDPWPKCKYAFRTQSNSKGGGIEGVRVPLKDDFFSFSGGKAELTITFGGKEVQTIPLDFPAGVNWPLPKGLAHREQDILTADYKMPKLEDGEDLEGGDALHDDLGGFLPDYAIKSQNNLSTKMPRPAVRREWAFSFERRLAWMITSGTREGEHSYAPWKAGAGADGKHYTDRWRNILQPGDTIRSLVLGKIDQPDMADPRLLALQTNAEGFFQPHPRYTTSDNHAETLRRGDGRFYFDRTSDPRDRPPTAPSSGSLVELPKGVYFHAERSPDLPIGMVARRHDGKKADFDTGLGDSPDGAYGGKADEGALPKQRLNLSTQKNEIIEPYFGKHEYDGYNSDEAPADTFFSPNRQVPSPVIFGSLLARGRGWETLLFSPNPAGENHPGLVSPRDHLLLDLFTMPVVEPYAISEPFSTAGKVNLNYQIMPFGYLKRSTALRAALQSVRVTAIPQTHAADYKVNLGEEKNKPPTMPNVRYLVNRNETLRAFDDFFAEFKANKSKGFFKSASEICDRFLYPNGDTHAGKILYRNKSEQMVQQTFWAKSALTGDNLREKPYADLYPRLTTRSNTYTVHYRAQTLRQRPFTGKGDEEAHYATWDENRDRVLSEIRGHSTIERYLDSEDKRFTLDAKGERTDVEKQSLEDAYRFRIIYNKRFSPW